MTDSYKLAAQAGDLLAHIYDSDDGRLPRIWAKARRRYLRRIAALPVPSPRPAWWTAADEQQRDPSLHVGGWCCRTCRLWRSNDGKIGFCGMPETPATTNCGKTDWADLCEQWDAYPTS